MTRINPKIFVVLSWVLMAAALITAVGFAEKSQHEVRCQGLEVVIMDSTGHYFVSPDDIKALFSSKSTAVEGKPLSTIDMRMMEKRALSNPYVATAAVYATIDGRIRMDIHQRDPVVRIINYNNDHFYIDRTGGFMPIGETYATRLPVASGFIFDKMTQMSLDFSAPVPDTSGKPLLQQVFEVAEFISKDDFWNAQIEQIYVNEDFDLELVPRVGNHTVLIGSSDLLSRKMENLRRFYTDGASRLGWQSYSKLNLKFIDQVVCTKMVQSKNDTLTNQQ
ncbi:MAG: cell division protein FtsQ/DivIB [Bacteroidia bacterium]